MRAIAAAAVIVTASASWAAEPQYMTYDEFIRQVEAGNVTSVTLDNLSSITGTLVDGVTTSEFESYGKIGSANDPLLVRFLKEHDVAVSMRDVSEPRHRMPLISGFLFLAAPVVFLILLIVIIMKLNQILDNQRRSQQETRTDS